MKFSKDFTDIKEGYKLVYLGKIFPTESQEKEGVKEIS